MRLPPHERDLFDSLLEEVMAELPESLVEVLEETPLIVEDVPSDSVLAEMGLADDPDAATSICGLHWGVPLPDRSVEALPELPEEISLYRIGILDLAGGWDGGVEEIRRQIRITLLHEIGHHYGLDEDDLENLGYG